VGPSVERAIKVPSCGACNNRSEEGLLKSFISLFDERIAERRLGDELLRRQGKGDRRSFFRTCTPDMHLAFPDERVTRLFKKMFQGLRRHLLKDAWTFVHAKNLHLFSITREGVGDVIRQLPLRVGGSDDGRLLPSGFMEELRFEDHFRDFQFGMIEPNVLALRYGRTFCTNELVLLGVFCP
jgi:hypothetical protein